MNSNQPEVWQWAITTLIALGAAGAGVVALLHYFRRPHLRTRLWMVDTPYYNLMDRSGCFDIIANRDALADLNPTSGTKNLFPDLRIDITNPMDRGIAVNEVRFSFSDLRKLETSYPAHDTKSVEVVINYQSDIAEKTRADFAQRYGLTWIRGYGRSNTYTLTAKQPVEEVLAKLATESELVAEVYLNAPAVPHKQFTETKPVEIKLDPERKLYYYSVGHTIEKHDTIVVPITVGASDSVQGHATISVVYDGLRIHKVSVIEFTIEVPPFLHAVEGNRRAVLQIQR